MPRSALYLSTVGVSLLVVAAACSASNKSSSGFGDGGSSGTQAQGTGTGQGGVDLSAVSAGSSISTASAVDCKNDPNVDGDGDGFTGAQGDCNDCDANVNPGAIDTGNDEDCDGQAMKPVACDGNLNLGDTNGMSGAKAIELCQQVNPGDVKWGVVSANYVRANGSPAQPGVQVGLLDSFGPNTHVQGGGKMLVLSSGAARVPGQNGACMSETCTYQPGTAPPNFPQDVPNCAGSKQINDDIAFEMKLHAPTNATGYKFNFKFYSYEFPFYVCSSYNDQFIALVNPPPMGSINGNISFDSKKNPVSVNIAFFDVCDPQGKPQFGSDCMFSNPNPGACPPPPNPYCPSGPGQLQGTGFDTLGGPGNSGATSWLETQAPIKGGDTFTIRFAIWDTGDQALDSTVLIDNFQWIANGGTVNVGTDPADNPK